MCPRPAREAYVQRVLDRYRALPGTLGHVRRSDCQLAAHLHDRGVPLDLVEAAFTVATCRRLFRSAGAEPLAPARTMHYYLPILEELIQTPPDPDYIRYLEAKLTALPGHGHEVPR